MKKALLLAACVGCAATQSQSIVTPISQGRYGGCVIVCRGKNELLLSHVKAHVCLYEMPTFDGCTYTPLWIQDSIIETDMPKAK